MHGLETIKKINDNPAAYHASREPQHYGAAEDRTEAPEQSKNDALLESIFNAIVGDKPKTAAQKISGMVDEIFLTAFILDVIRNSDHKEPEHQERIHSAIDAQPPFIQFWERLNGGLLAAGKPEAGYGQAREAFLGGKTPVGSLTFVGKEWDGLRAVPAEPVKYLGGTRPVYHGEHREVTGHGTLWHKVINDTDEPIVYKLPEAALTAARDAKKAAIDKAFR